MVAGVPVVLPKRFEPVFGAEALYRGSNEVLRLVARLCSDPSLYKQRVDPGRDFASQYTNNIRVVRLRAVMETETATL